MKCDGLTAGYKMLQSYKAVLKGKQLEWVDDVSANNQPILVYMTLLKEEPIPQQLKLPEQAAVDRLEEIADLNGAVSKTVFEPDDEMIESSTNGILELLNINWVIYKKGQPVSLAPTKDVLHSKGKCYNVVGQHKYKSGQPHPYYVKVTDIEIYPDEKELPSLYLTLS